MCLSNHIRFWSLILETFTFLPLPYSVWGFKPSPFWPTPPPPSSYSVLDSCLKPNHRSQGLQWSSVTEKTVSNVLSKPLSPLFHHSSLAFFLSLQQERTRKSLDNVILNFLQVKRKLVEMKSLINSRSLFELFGLLSLPCCENDFR